MRRLRTKRRNKPTDKRDGQGRAAQILARQCKGITSFTTLQDEQHGEVRYYHVGAGSPSDGQICRFAPISKEWIALRFPSKTDIKTLLDKGCPKAALPSVESMLGLSPDPETAPVNQTSFKALLTSESPSDFLSRVGWKRG